MAKADGSDTKTKFNEIIERRLREEVDTQIQKDLRKYAMSMGGLAANFDITKILQNIS